MKKETTIEAKTKSARFKSKSFWDIDSDFIIDFQNKTATFPNPLTMFDDKGIVFLLTMFLIFEFLLFFSFTNIVNNTNTYFLVINRIPDMYYIVVSPFIAFAFAFGFLMLSYLSQKPEVQRALEKIHKKIYRKESKPIRTAIIKNPIHFKTTMFGGFSITLQGECSKYCDKAIFKRKMKGRNDKPELEVIFLKQKSGILIVKEYFA